MYPYDKLFYTLAYRFCSFGCLICDSSPFVMIINLLVWADARVLAINRGMVTLQPERGVGRGYCDICYFLCSWMVGNCM